MSDLKQLITEQLANDPTIVNKIIAWAGMNNPRSLSIFLTTNKENLNFHTVLEIVRRLFPEREQELMRKFILSLNPNKTLVRYALEYACINRLDDLLDEIIDTLSHSDNRKNRESAFVYGIDRQLDRNELSNSEAIRLLKQHTYVTSEMKIYSKILEIYCEYPTSSYLDLYTKAGPLAAKIAKLKDTYIHECYLARYGLIMTALCIHLGKREDVFRYSEHVLVCEGLHSLKCQIHIHLGNLYIFSHYENALFHFKKALFHCVHETRMTEIKRSLNFIHNYWGKKPEYLDFKSSNPSDVHEVAFYHIQQGNDRKGLEILNTLDWENLTPTQKAFHLFYKGIAKNDRECFFKSVRYFNEVGDSLYKQLPLIQLEKMGESEEIILALK